MRRWIVQLTSTLAMNSNFQGFIQGKIYKGPMKNACVPGLNCYSCPGAIGSCPIGSLQAVIGTAKYHVSFYILGFLSLMGVLFGRLICGWMCPFGFVQDLIGKITKKKWHLPKIFTYLKYIVLLVFVFWIPMFVTNIVGMGDPAFCKYICPSGTLMGAFPLLLVNVGLRQALGILFTWKVIVLILVLIMSVKIDRFFCKTLCPLGAFYALFNRVSFYQLSVNEEACIDCKQCEKVCPMDVSVKNIGKGAECIRCGKCKEVCPTKAIVRNKVFLKKTKGVMSTDSFPMS